MNPDILIMRVDEGYRVLHGHLHLINAFSVSSEVIVEARDQGQLKVRKTRDGMVVEHDNDSFPLLQY